jgi:hypothetical protein
VPRLKHAARDLVPNPSQTVANFVFVAATSIVSLALFIVEVAELPLYASENIEKLIPLVALLLISLAVWGMSRRKKQSFGLFAALVAVVALVLMAFQLIVVAYPRPDYSLSDFPSLSPGLVGISLAIGVAAFWVLVIVGRFVITSSRLYSSVIGVISLIMAGAVLGFVAFRNYRYLGWELRQADSLPVLDEFVAVAFGQIPLANYAGLYQNLLALPLQWIPGEATPSLAGVMTYLVALQLLVVVISVTLIALVVPRLWWWLGFLLFFALLFLPSFLGLSVFDFWSNMPARYLFPALLGLFVVAVSRQREVVPRGRRTHMLLVFTGGFVAGASAINNLDFGIPAAAAFILVVVLASLANRSFSAIGAAIAGLVLAFIAYSFYGFLMSEPIDWQMWAAFALSYQGLEWWAIPMPFVGVHLLILATLLATFAFALYTWLRRNPSGSNALQMLLLYFSTVGTIAFVYFAGRSHLGVTVSLNFFLGMCLALWVPTVLSTTVNELKSGRRLKLFVSSLWPAAWVGVAFFAFVWGTPVDVAPTRAVSAASVDGWYAEGSVESQGRGIASALKSAGVDLIEVGLLIPSSALISGAADIKGSMLVPLPIYLDDVRGLAEAQCRLWQRSKVKYVLGVEPPKCAQPGFVGTVAGRDLWAIKP